MTLNSDQIKDTKHKHPTGWQKICQMRNKVNDAIHTAGHAVMTLLLGTTHANFRKQSTKKMQQEMILKAEAQKPFPLHQRWQLKVLEEGCKVYSN